MILDEIVESVKIRIEHEKSNVTLTEMKQLATTKNNSLEDFAFEEALREGEISFICEVKKASPSKGVIATSFPYLEIAKDYEKAGATCISVLTEPKYFQGADCYLEEIKTQVKIPVLRKDFIIDEYQIYQAKKMGADAVLLICTILDAKTLKKYIHLCDALGMSAVIEAHDKREVKEALAAGGRVIGVNNRNLKDFSVEIETSLKLREMIPSSVLFLAESGIKTAYDIEQLKAKKVDGVLIGETLMRANNKTKALNRLRGTKVKICGIKCLEDIEIMNRVQPDYVGFVFAKSRRMIDDECAKHLREQLDDKIQTVGVFVNDTIEHIVHLCKEGIIDLVQLHGDEDANYIRGLSREINKPIIKALRVTAPLKMEEVEKSEANYLLYDSYTKEQYGGSGHSFDVEDIKGAKRPYFLAGGLSISNVEGHVTKVRPYCVDVSSGVEINGKKDRELVREFVEKVRRCNG